MFGPNHKPSYHHREHKFEELYENLQERFACKFYIDRDVWDIFFITGSGTAANEVMLHSFNEQLNVVTKGHFSQRITEYLWMYDKVNWLSEYVVGVQYETSESKYYGDFTGSIATLSDCVSAFPYYKPNADIWTTVNSKQLGGSPGLGIVVVKKNMFYNGLLKPVDASYMSLGKYKLLSEKRQTPHTPAITLMEELFDILQEFDLDKHRRMIDTRRDRLVNIFGEDEIIGEGPVLTIKNSLKSGELQRQFNLYNNGGNPQIFLWSGTDKQYEQFYDEAERIMRK